MFQKWRGNLFFCRLENILYCGGLFLQRAGMFGAEGIFIIAHTETEFSVAGFADFC